MMGKSFLLAALETTWQPWIYQEDKKLIDFKKLIGNHECADQDSITKPPRDNLSETFCTEENF